MDYNTLTKDQLLDRLSSLEFHVRIHQSIVERYDKPWFLGGLRGHAESAKSSLESTQKEISKIYDQLRRLD